jgi:cell division protein ZapD
MTIATHEFEQPLNERMRSFMRLEHLYRRFDYQLNQGDEWSHRGAVEALIEVLALLGRADMKTEFIKELERHAQTLDALQRDPRVDGDTLRQVLDRVRAELADLRATESPFGYQLKSHDLINSVRQRASIPAGMCDFDLPTLHHWLQRPVEQRNLDLHSWCARLSAVRSAVTLCLALVRESATATNEVAVRGFFQKQLEGNVPCQLVRVCVASEERVFTEISAGKHRFSVRFMHHDPLDERPTQCNRDISFELSCCVI